LGHANLRAVVVGGAVPIRGGVTDDLALLETQAHHATIQPGWVLDDLRAYLRKHSVMKLIYWYPFLFCVAAWALAAWVWWG
jgi:hypothetical protein